MRKIIAILIVLAGAGGGVALGLQLRPESGAAGTGHAAVGSLAAPEDSRGAAETGGHGGTDGGDRNYVSVGRQIIVPVVREGRTRALMLFEVAVDVPNSMTERAYSAEPRLRDVFLRELFEMSYTGAFMTTYTDDRVVNEIRERLRAAARRVLGDAVKEVLILDIMRQEY